MSVYFIQVGGYFKVGASDDPARRCERLHLSGTRYTFPPGVSLDPADRSIYRVVEGWKSSERAVHRALDDFTVGLEWFLDEPEVRDFIDSLPADQEPQYPLPKVVRPGGWCRIEYERVQDGRAEREVARYLTRKAAS